MSTTPIERTDEQPFLPPQYYGHALDGAPVFKHLERSPSVRLLREMLRRHVRPGMRVLDIGCGNAIGACHLAASGARGVAYVGIDPDPEVCAEGRIVLAHLPPGCLDGRIVTQSVEDLMAAVPVPVDLVYWNWSFHCCVDAHALHRHAPLAAAVARLVAPGGALLLGDGFAAPGAGAEEIERIRAYNAYLVAGRSPGNRYPSPEAIADLFADAGLAMVERRDVLAVPLGRYLGMPNWRYALQVFRRADGPS